MSLACVPTPPGPPRGGKVMAAAMAFSRGTVSGACVPTPPGPPLSRGGKVMAAAMAFSRGTVSWACVPTPPWPPLIKGGKGHGGSEKLMSDAFTNRVALVTGGSRGIGRSTALRLAREGADVAISFASRTQDAEQVVAEIEALGRKAICVPCNVARPDDVQSTRLDNARAIGADRPARSLWCDQQHRRPYRPDLRTLARNDRRELERRVSGRVRGQGRR